MLEKMNERVKRLDYVDIKLIKWATFIAAIAVVKFFPQLLKIDYWILIVLVVLCTIRPARKYFSDKDK